MSICALQVTQWKAEAERLEETSAALARDMHEAQAAISKSRTRQEALELQARMRALEADRSAAAEARTALEDCRGALERMGGESRRSAAAVEASRVQVKELQEALRGKEAAVAALRGAAGGDSLGCASPPIHHDSVSVRTWLFSFIDSPWRLGPRVYLCIV